MRGFFGAFDAKTGKQVWGFWLVPGPGEPGHDTWEGDSWRHGGAPVWTHPAIDPALGVVYMPREMRGRTSTVPFAAEPISIRRPSSRWT